MRNIVNFSVLEFLRLAIVPVLHRPIVSGNAAVHFCLCTADGTGILLTGYIPVIAAHGVCGRECIVRELIVLRNLAHQVGCSLPVRQFFTKECVEHGTRRIQCLEIVLNVQR